MPKKYCSECGEANQFDQKFCGSCGESLQKQFSSVAKAKEPLKEKPKQKQKQKQGLRSVAKTRVSPPPEESFDWDDDEDGEGSSLDMADYVEAFEVQGHQPQQTKLGDVLQTEKLGMSKQRQRFRSDQGDILKQLKHDATARRVHNVGGDE